jgi:hypothetical protein
VARFVEAVEKLLLVNPGFEAQLGMPQGFAMLAATIFDQVLASNGGRDRRDFRRAVVLQLIHTRETELATDAKAAARDLVKIARAIEEAVEAEDRRDAKRERPPGGTIARDLLNGGQPGNE